MPVALGNVGDRGVEQRGVLGRELVGAQVGNGGLLILRVEVQADVLPAFVVAGMPPVVLVPCREGIARIHGFGQIRPPPTGD